MQQSEFQQIREWYQQFEDAVLFYRMDGTPLWQNHAATLRQDQDGASLPRYAPDGTPETGTFSVRQGSVLYLLRQKQCRIGGTPGSVPDGKWDLTVLAPDCRLEDGREVAPGVMLDHHGKEVSK